MTIPDEAVQAASDAYENRDSNGADLIALEAALTAAAPFLQGVKVKGLEWAEVTDGKHNAWAHPFGLQYCVYVEEGNWTSHGLVGKSTTFHDYGLETEAAAKAAAQADYEALILSAIEVAPSPRAQAFTEKLVKQAMHEAWNDICYDTGCHPLDIHRVKRGELMFIPDHWASATYERLCALSSQPVADEKQEAAKTLLSGNMVKLYDACSGICKVHKFKAVLEKLASTSALPASPGASE